MSNKEETPPPKPAFPADYVPPKVWKLEEDENSKNNPFASVNRPTAGARFEKTLPRGQHPYQLYSSGTPNGVKVTILFEELNDLKGTEYDAWAIDFLKEMEQFGSDFVNINPNSKIPAMLDVSVDPPIRVFESGSILKYVAEKEGGFIPKDPRASVECFNWLFWQMGTGPLLGGGFGHFYRYAPVSIKYAIDRFSMEAKRQFDVLDQHLAKSTYLAGEEYSIADIAVWPWLFCVDYFYKASEYLDVDSYKNLSRWYKEISERPAVKRGIRVNGFVEGAVQNRHSRADFDTESDTKKEE